MTSQELAAAMALMVKDYVRTDRAALEARLAVAEARLADLQDVRDRLVTVETKAATPLPADPVIGELRDQIRTIETRVPTHELWDALKIQVTDYRARVEMLETKVAQPIPSPVVSGFSAAEQELALVNRVEPLTKQIAGLSERLVVVETRAPIPGPVGQDGKDGKDGLNGKDGADALGFDDLIVEQPDERTAVVKAVKGEHVKVIGTLKFHHEVYRDIWSEGTTYERGDCCTWAGSEWHANETTTAKPGEGTKAWRLKVKRGRDGKDGRDGLDAVRPVVSLGSR